MRALEGFQGRVLILYGDVPLLELQTIQALRNQDAAVVLITTRLAEPKGYGRIVRVDGAIQKIVEEKDASAEERRLDEVNAGIYLVESNFLKDALSRLRSDNAQGEYYLTDIVALALADGKKVSTVAAPAEQVRGANTRAELASLDAVLRRNINERHMAAGVTLVDPDRTYISAETEIGRDTIIQPGVHLRGKTVVGARCSLDVGCVITASKIEDDVELKPYSVLESAQVGTKAIVGPFSRLRPDAQIGESAHVGNFVEIKKATLGRGAKANHLAYIGDATVGAQSNIGAGTITCNYDGYGKYLTEIGESVFVGSNSTLVAPVQIQDRAYVAAGSVITDPVATDDVAFGRARQVNKTGRAPKLREEAQKAANKKK